MWLFWSRLRDEQQEPTAAAAAAAYQSIVDLSRRSVEPLSFCVLGFGDIGRHITRPRNDTEQSVELAFALFQTQIRLRSVWFAPRSVSFTFKSSNHLFNEKTKNSLYFSMYCSSSVAYGARPRDRTFTSTSRHTFNRSTGSRWSLCTWQRRCRLNCSRRIGRWRITSRWNHGLFGEKQVG